MPFPIIPFLLLAWPAAEIAVFIIVGSHIGVLPTLALIVLTAIVGSILLRIQGFGLLARMRDETERGNVPGRELVHGVMILLAGILLITPGFITDVLGLLLFIPPIRDLAWKLFKDRIVILSSSQFGGRTGGEPSGQRRRSPPVIDLDADDFERDPDRPSPWNRDRKDD